MTTADAPVQKAYAEPDGKVLSAIAKSGISIKVKIMPHKLYGHTSNP